MARNKHKQKFDKNSFQIDGHLMIGTGFSGHACGSYAFTNLTYHLTGLFYYTLCNIEPALRAKLRAIMLVAIVETAHINQYGIDEILKPFIESMQQLESVGLVTLN